MYRARVFLDGLVKAKSSEALNLKVEIANLGDLKSKLSGFSDEVADLVTLVSDLEDAEVDKKVISSIESDYLVLEKGIKSLGIALNNILSNLKKV